MKKLLETLYITTPESYLFERNGNICISIGGTEKASVREKYTFHSAAVFLLKKQCDHYFSQRKRLFSGTSMRPGQRKCVAAKATI